MLIKEIDFTNIKDYKNTDVIPVFMQYGNECFEICSNKKYIDNSWSVFLKLFYYKFYLDYKDYMESFFEQRLFSSPTKKGIIAFSRSDKTFHNETSTDRTTAAKFGVDAYVYISNVKYNNLVILKRVLKDIDLNNFKLFVTTENEILDSNFKKELSNIKKTYSKKKKNPYKIKKGNLVVGHINGLVLSKQEKLIKYVRTEFKKKNLIGDIILNEEQESLLNEYMTHQLQRFTNNCANFRPDYSSVFALGLVRYAMKHYNTRGTGDFWPYFKNEYGITITANNQKYIHDIFEGIMKKYDMVYENEMSLKINNMTMHSFVADHSANQLFDYLFDFWRLDLGRNSDNLNSIDKTDSSFDTLISAMENGTQDVMAHTSILLNFSKTRAAFKSRVKRIIRLMNDAFWNDTTINETGNRINHLLNIWINNPKGAFKKEKNYVTKHSSKGKGETLFHSPVFNVNYQDDQLKIILPQQRLVECTVEDTPMWIIKSTNPAFKTMQIGTNQHYKHDKISCYVERIAVDIPFEFMLSGFEFTLISGDKEIKKYKILPSSIRFFDDKGKYINHENSIIPNGFITSYSDNESYPDVLGETCETLNCYGLFMKCFNLVNGQIITLEDLSGIQVGQKLTVGLTEVYPINGAKLLNNGVSYMIYSNLPKLLFKANIDELNGISLVINGKQNKVVDKPIIEFKVADDLKTSGYLIDLYDYIKSEGLFNITLGFPKMHKKIELGSIAYIKGFNYKFIDAPYIFEENALIKFEKNVRIDKNTGEYDGTWTSDYSGNSFLFNFGERNKNSENYCNLVVDEKLVLNCYVGTSKYPIYFEVPALYWKYNSDEEWNSKKPANLALKDFKNKHKKLYVTGPFNLSKSKITTTDDVDIAEEESEIRFIDGKYKYFEIEKVYDWFKNDRSETYRKLFITVDDRKIDLLNVICKSKLNNVSLIGDYDNNTLNGSLDIEGDESYTISIYHNGKTICEDEQVVNKEFSIETELETGDYEIYVYEIVEDDDEDGFDIATETILLNKKPIVKKLINLNNLENQEIMICGYQDIKRMFMPQSFGTKYVISQLEKTSYSKFLEEEEDSEIYGIWNRNIDYMNEEEMNSYSIYRGRLGTYRYDDSFIKLMNVIVIFTDKMNPESILILAKDADGEDYGSLMINKRKGWIIPGYQYKKMSRADKRNCDSFYDDQSLYLIDIVEGKYEL